MSNIGNWPTQRWPWIILAVTALAFEIIALYFQYGMGLEPCIMCIYQRTAVFGVLFAAIIAAISPQNILFRLAGFIGWGVSAIWGTLIALEHVEMQTNTNPFAFFTCEIEPNFPSWMPLHHWIPSIFEATGSCDSIDWQFLGFSMPQWMIVVFAAYSVVFALMFIIRFKHAKLI
ncbi:disulfide bond formation protein DsbB [Flocculibacter collagenilyticus]|uniref:disulfide bond formation protein DsbB n=1 Tax=Flocculibacter collagenilyticus TaxID=2744479 RepID=UPI0018F3725A|nr:disulfide bond formation protein DsbB [Flocculibacter collagenilyticus]